MRRATLLYNPKAGRASDHAGTIENAAQVLRERGVLASVAGLASAERAGEQARAAVAGGADAVFACGGDGTVHAVLQGMVGTEGATLGVIPLGSANVLARHLRLPLDPVEAALQQLQWQPKEVPVGEVHFLAKESEQSRYFLALAGAGPDGALVYDAAAVGKRWMGRLHYYLRAAKLFATGSFKSFPVEYTAVNGDVVHTEAVSAMAVRVDDLGGLFSPLIRGGRLTDEHMRLTLVRGPAVATLPAWFATSHLGKDRVAETIEVLQFTCGGDGVRVQADGESLGTTPMRVRTIANAVRLLMPPEDR